ncbi:sulfotransferase ssu-1-like [Argiope bruennichi]|uniref:Sulfotransferase 1C2A like protein n=1 Tax=Argiope bruennichi TaxID=94029 RepID=A0A8T0E2E4_ARGBR|nr:sulfotransferase ssu-1-like [Argiope bruennichi]XP_055937065.1 sulfotransferase ssu-1-like [Argiope bruennichi]XP_055937074.1 sulfotransferase ssu-1-like [Argiope bruennichi]KAF8764337.1 Sulfotransferase 1C2A like protein [Argiope bruennichi]
MARRPRYAIMNGIRYPEMFSPKCFREALEYKPEPGDVFICTYPKCGTTWIQHVALYIFRKGRKIENPRHCLKLSPFIDQLGKEGIDGMPRPGAFKTHLPFPYISYSSKAKYIFVSRDPKDCCVSRYYHTKFFPGFDFENGEFNDFFELFMSGELGYNDYFDHLLSWYPYRNDSNVFYTRYEDMKKDIKSVIMKLSKFLGKEYLNAIEMDNNVLNNIILYSGFDHMKMKMSETYKKRDEGKYSELEYEGFKHIVDFTASLEPTKISSERNFFRKGLIGDWRSHFSSEQKERMDRKFLEKFKGTEIIQWYPLE